MVCPDFPNVYPRQLMTPLSATRLQGNSRAPFRLRVVYTGFGTGREAFNAAVLSADGAFVRALIGQVSYLLCHGHVLIRRIRCRIGLRSKWVVAGGRRREEFRGLNANGSATRLSCED
jgi:hypothetical protein